MTGEFRKSLDSNAALLVLAGGIWLFGWSSGWGERENEAKAAQPSAAGAVPQRGAVDTLSLPASALAAAGEGMLLAEGQIATGPSETFLLAEVRAGERDTRYDLALNQPPRPASPGTGVPASAAAAFALAPGDSGPRLSTDDLIRQIESLRQGFREAPEVAPAAEPAAAPRPEGPVAPIQQVGRADDSAAGNAGAGEIRPAAGSRVSAPAPAKAEEKPYVFARPAARSGALGAKLAARMSEEGALPGAGAHAAGSVPAAAGEVEIAAVSREAAAAPYREVASAAAGTSPRRGLLGKIFSKKPTREERAAAASAAAASQPTLEAFPQPEAPRTKASKEEEEAQEIIDAIYGEYAERVSRITAGDLDPNGSKSLPAVPAEFDTVWLKQVGRSHAVGVEPLAVRLEEIYARALIHSNRVRVFGYDPLIRETAIGESEGAFDLESFVNGNYGHSDDPTSSLLDTGQAGRFLENRGQGEAGVRRRFATGGQVSLSNRFLTLDNNSEFLQPNPQTSSNLVLSVVQPLMRGGGYHYNKARLKVAKVDSGVAAAEYIQRLENHLLEVNQAYWGVYFARASHLLRQSLVGQTAEIVQTLEARSDEATASELLRSRSELSRRRVSLNRAEMAVRNAEEKLRSLVNDPEFPIGGEGEFVPLTAPLMAPPHETVHGAAMEALDNRPEIAASFGQVRLAAIRHHAGKHEMMPQLDLLAESRLAGQDADRRVGGAYDDMFSQQAGWLVGFQFSQPWERNLAKSRHERLQYELLQQADLARATMDTILLESVVTYRELMTVYRDMQGNFQQVLSTREETRGLRERLEVDADNEQTVAYRLQNVMDALERNQLAEEQFLASVVTYNIAFASLERAKGTFLRYQDVSIERSAWEDDPAMETLRAVPAASPGGSSGPGASGRK